MTTAVLAEPAPPCSVLLDHLSWSGIKAYQSCPRKFSYRYIEQVPEEFKKRGFEFIDADPAAQAE